MILESLHNALLRLLALEDPEDWDDDPDDPYESEVL